MLATDALAAWFLRQTEHDDRPWEQLRGLTSEQFDDLVENLRKAGEMRNDDVTLVLAYVSPVDPG